MNITEKNQSTTPQDTPQIYLAVLNITSYVGQCGDAEHVYGHLILSNHAEVTVDNVEEWNVKYLGETIEITRPLTLEIAKALDKKDGHKTHQRHFRMMQDKDKFIEEYPEIQVTIRFDTFEEVVNAGIEKWKELNIECPFISLYEGKKYKANSYEPTSTVILQYEKL